MDGSILTPPRQNESMQESRADAAPERDSTQAGELMDLAPGIDQIFPNDFPELRCRVEASEGILPEFVRGSYYLNGPARFGIGDFRYSHWLDGDGMVSCLRFTSDGAHLTSRYVQSTKLLAEREAGKPVYRTFGTGFAGSRLNRANNGLESPANVSIYPFGQRLLAQSFGGGVIQPAKVAGITAKGLFNSNPLLVETERQMMRCADEVTVLADHSKVGRQALAFLCAISAIDVLILDHDLSPAQRKLLRGAGARIVLAGPSADGRNGRRGKS